MDNFEKPRPLPGFFIWVFSRGGSVIRHLGKNLALIIAVVLLSGCGQIGYYAHCTKGHLALLAERTPISDLLKDPATPDELRCRLLEVQQIRDFASDSLKLPENGSYRSYADLRRPYATWNVVAAPEFSLEPYQWCFPIAGCVTYRGFFDRHLAEKFAEDLRRQGLDVYIYGVAAYSTLGWFDDPVLNTFLDQPPPVLAGMIFHELAHQRLYLPDDTTFSESFAMTVELLGVEKWLATRDCGTTSGDYRHASIREDDFNRLLENFRDKLSDLYLQPLPVKEKRQLKKKLFEGFVGDYADWKSRWGGYAGYDRWIDDNLNNAKLASASTYRSLIPIFRALFARHQFNFASFYRAVEHVARLSTEERSLTLEKLRQIFLADQSLSPSWTTPATKVPESL